MKPKIVFVTFYDTVCLGVRLLSAVAQKAGCDTSVVYIKREVYSPLFKRKDPDSWRRGGR